MAHSVWMRAMPKSGQNAGTNEGLGHPTDIMHAELTARESCHFCPRPKVKPSDENKVWLLLIPRLSTLSGTPNRAQSLYLSFRDWLMTAVSAPSYFGLVQYHRHPSLVTCSSVSDHLSFPVHIETENLGSRSWTKLYLLCSS